ncbi:hypothetical protein GCM10011404_17270 [Sphingomonas prati]|nr:hypothetical protein GCM10011404_17270 [Sphingomonas prati]
MPDGEAGPKTCGFKLLQSLTDPDPPAKLISRTKEFVRASRYAWSSVTITFRMPLLSSDAPAENRTGVPVP